VHVLREFRKPTARSWSPSAPAPSTAACRRSATTSTCATSSEEVYQTEAGVSHGIIPNDPELPLPLNKVHPIHEVVKVDYFLPGCPPPADAIWKLLTDLLAGRTPTLGHGLMHYD
jgi:NAD-reducing hydrogenase small subunit